MAQQKTYDLLIKGGTLMDPAQDINDRRDIAVKNGRVAQVAQRIDPTTAGDVLDVTGKVVTPGLIDLHGHFYHGGNPTACDANYCALEAGCTTGVDAGSSGWANYRAMKDYIFPTKDVRLLAFIHIGATGILLNGVVGGELQDIRHANVDRTVDAIKAEPGFFLGVKVRMQRDAVAHWEARTALHRAREAADKAGVKLMVHVSGTPIPLPEILDVLGPGDIATHAYNGNPENILDKNDRVRREIRAAAERGVVMDVGHAGVHCDVEVSKAAIAEGFYPTSISTDIHNPPPERVVYGMNDLVSKFHAMGQPLEDALAASTSRPAGILGLDKEIGTLAQGAVADLAIFDLQEGNHVWQDMAGHTVSGNLRLATFATLKDGVVVWREGSYLGRS